MPLQDDRIKAKLMAAIREMFLKCFMANPLVIVHCSIDTIV